MAVMELIAFAIVTFVRLTDFFALTNPLKMFLHDTRRTYRSCQQCCGVVSTQKGKPTLKPVFLVKVLQM